MTAAAVTALAGRTPAGLRTFLGSVRRRFRTARPAGGAVQSPPWFDPGTDTWTPFDGQDPANAPAVPLPSDREPPVRHCNICRWQGERFGGPAHCEAATCPRCGSIGRDRFLFWSMQHTVTPDDTDTAAGDGARPLRLLETSPRLGAAYRTAMAHWFDYLCSDFDERAHAGMIHIDLQSIDLPSDCIDVILSPHVLEHVPDTDSALGELFRVLRPGGTLLLQVPILQGRTAPPVVPEFHGDDTPVFWRFGPDLSDRLTAAGFAVALLAPAALVATAGAPAGGSAPWPEPVSPEFDADAVLAGLTVTATPDAGQSPVPRPELRSVATPEQTERYGFEPVYMFLTFSARKPA